LQGEVRGLVGKIKVKNTVTVSQEKLLQDTSGKLESVEKDLQSTRQQLVTRDEQVRPHLCRILLLHSANAVQSGVGSEKTKNLSPGKKGRNLQESNRGRSHSPDEQKQ